MREKFPSPTNREEIQFSVGASGGGGVEDPFDLVGIVEIGLDGQAEWMQLERAHDSLPGERTWAIPSPWQAMTVCITRAVSRGSRTIIESTPASWTG